MAREALSATATCATAAAFDRGGGGRASGEGGDVAQSALCEARVTASSCVRRLDEELRP